MDSDQGRSPEQWRLDDILTYLHLDDTQNAKEILHSILTSTDILTWNSQGEIVYRGHDIRGTDIADLLRYCVTHYNPDVPEPYGMNIFLKGLTSLEIDKGLIVNKKVLAELARMQHESEDSQSEEEDTDTSCNNCNKGLNITHLGTCPICTWTDFYRKIARCYCTVCDFKLNEVHFTHTIACCPHCHCDEIVNTNE